MLACNSSFEVIDISDPTLLGVVGSVETGGRDLVIMGEQALVAEGVHHGQVQMIDISDPTSPTVGARMPVVRNPEAAAP